MISNKKFALLDDNSTSPIVTESVAMLRDANFDDRYIEQFADDVVGVLNDYAELVGEGTEIEYSLNKGLVRIELRALIPGEQYNPLESGADAKRRKLASVATLNLNTETAKVSYRYAFERNIVSVSVPLSERRKGIIKNPMVIAVILGIVLGFLCQCLPGDVSGFIVDEIASPLLSIILNIISGIMGPVIFISMVTSIIAMHNINELTDLGFKIIRRFIVIILFLTAVSIFVSGLFFRSFGTGSVNFAPEQLIQMVFDVIPVNPFQSFLENKTPQLVILGFVLGCALLILGDSVDELKKMLIQINEWVMSAMKLVLLVVPAIPFLSIFTALARGNGSEILEGWKFIVASYIVFGVCTAFKMVKTSMTTSIGVPELWRKIKPLVKVAFTTGSTAAPIKQAYEVSEEDFNIKPEFTAFWIPMCSAMLSPKTTINVVIATFMVAELTGVAISTSFLFVLILVTLELSIASPGTTSSWAIVFSTLMLPTDYVGLFTVYRLLAENFGAACTEAYVVLEEVEAAYKLDGLKGSPAREPLGVAD